MMADIIEDPDIVILNLFYCQLNTHITQDDKVDMHHSKPTSVSNKPQKIEKKYTVIISILIVKYCDTCQDVFLVFLVDLYMPGG